jgi:transglycosylase-like protein with SLT domain
MAVATSVWFVMGDSRVVRNDSGTPEGLRWSEPYDRRVDFPQLWALLAPLDADARLAGAFQSGPDELVFVTPGSMMRIDLVRGVVVEGPELPAGHWGSLRITDPTLVAGLPDLVAGLPDLRIDDPEHVIAQNRDGWGFYNPRTDTFDGPHSGEELQIRINMSDTSCGVQLPGGRLFVFDATAGTFQVFSVRLGLVEGDTVHQLAELFPPLAATGLDGPKAAWRMTADRDRWAEGGSTGEVKQGTLRAIRAAARGAGIETTALMAVADAESGLRTDAYHPAGRYGLLQLTPAQLKAAGWDEPPAVLAATEQQQTDLLQDVLQFLPFPSEPSPGMLWAALLQPDGNSRQWNPMTVVAAPMGPRRKLWQSHGGFDVDGDMKLTIGDLEAHLKSRAMGRRSEELGHRLEALA